jgi:hypothetical protein
LTSHALTFRAPSGPRSAPLCGNRTSPSQANASQHGRIRRLVSDIWGDGDKTSSFPVYGYSVANTMVQVLKPCGDDPTRENAMRQTANLKDFETAMEPPGIKINTSVAVQKSASFLQRVRDADF